MASLEYGYANIGERDIHPYPVKAGEVITARNAVTLNGGYVEAVDASSDKVYGFAYGTATGGAADGDVSVQIDISETSVYRLPPDEGTVSQALLLATANIGADGLSVNIDSSGTGTLLIVDVDTVNNQLLVKLNLSPAGVV